MKNLEENKESEVPFIMSEADAELFFETCENPPAPPAKMIEMFKQINTVAKWFPFILEETREESEPIFIEDFFSDEEYEVGDVRVMLDLLRELDFAPTDDYSTKVQGACFVHSKLYDLVVVVCPGLGGWYYLLNDVQHGPRGQYSEYYSHKREDIIRDFKTTPIRDLFRDVKIESFLNNV